MLQSKTYKKILPAIVLAAFSLFPEPAAVQASVPSLPALNWQQQSDWINVKQDIKPAAYGDGVHDDTAAIQAGLNLLNRGWYGRKTLYLPTGTYVISKTLTLDKIYGAAIIGQGKSTRILWRGPKNVPMYWSNGVSSARYVGLVWDGNGQASVGIDHASKTFYEGSIRHQDEAFVNFLSSGIRVGYNQVVPTSEMTFRNCLFQKCGSGISFLSANDYNNNFDGCEFQDNNISINCQIGNVYVRDCHFERSKIVDIYLSSHSHSIRRCTSIGSKQFIFVPGAGSACPLTVQDCHIDSWTGSQGAIQLAMRGPDTIFDCSFSHAPDAKAPVRLTNSYMFSQSAFVSNNVTAAPSVVDPGDNSQIYQLPAGQYGPSLTSPSRSFLKSTETVPTTVLDVKQLFGANGQAQKDDTIPILHALAMAKAVGGNTVVYFPAGDYRVSQPLPLTGGQYTVEGSGHDSRIIWIGAKNSTVFSVQDPQNLALKHLSILAPLDTACISQTSAGAATSKMAYEQLWVSGTVLGTGDAGGAYGNITKAQTGRGLECVGLPSGTTVTLDDFYGSNHYTNCSRATILGQFVSGGVLQVDGAQYPKTGFLGILSHNAALNLCDVIVKDNQDLVGTNFYTEQTQSALAISGDGALLGQPGHVTIQGSKTQTYDPIAIRINNYEGRLTYTDAGIYTPTSIPIAQVGTRPLSLVLLGDVFTGLTPAFSYGTNVKLTAVANCVFASDMRTAGSLANSVSGSTSDVKLMSSAVIPNGVNTASLVPATQALDDFRLLGAADLSINYP